MTLRTIDAGHGVMLAATDEGEGPAVVLLHGLTASRRYVVMGSSALQRGGHRVVGYDARGHGGSSPAPDPDAYGYDLLAADLEAVLDARGIPRAVLAGVSMGAHTCLRLALERPERVAGLVVITPGFDPVELADPQRLARWDALSDALRSSGIEAFAEAFGVQRLPESWRETVGRALRQRMAEHEHLDAVADALRGVPRSAPFRDLHALEEIECPALVIGSRDEADPGHPLELAELYAELLPQGRLAVEEEGSSPLAWQGGRVSKLVAEVVAARRRLAPVTAAGYSGTPLVRKLGFKPGMRVHYAGAPDGFAELVGDLPERVLVLRRAADRLDLAVLFATERRDLERGLATLHRRLQPAGMIWVAWPKRASKVPTDITEDVVRDVALPRGLVDVKVCAIDEVWSGLKLVIRSERRRPTTNSPATRGSRGRTSRR